MLYPPFKWKGLVCLAFISTFLGVIAGTYLVTPQWEATAKILVRENPRLQPVLFKELVRPGEQTQKVKPSSNIVEIMISREMAQEAVEKFGLDKRLYQKKNEPPDLRDKVKRLITNLLIEYPKSALIAIGLLEEEEKDYVADAVDDFMDDWEDISTAEESDVVSIGIWGETPQLATDISNFIAERTMTKTLELANINNVKAYEFAKSQLPIVSEKLKAAEEQLRAFKRDNSIAEPDEEIRIKMNRIDKVEADIAQVEGDRKENSEKIRELKSHLDEQEKGIIEAGFIAGNTLVVNLKTSLAEQEATLSSLRAEKTEKHPDVIALQNKINETKETLRQEIQKIVASKTETMSPIYQNLVERLIDAQIDEFVLSIRWMSLSSTRKSLKDTTMALSDKSTELGRLAREVDILDALYKDFQTQVEELQILNKSAISDVDMRVIDPGFVPESADPSWPSWKIVIPVGFLVALLTALVFPFVIEYWGDSVRAWEVEEVLGKPIAGEIPRA